MLHPSVPLVLAGRKVTVREYTFWESMDIIYSEREFLDAVVALLLDNRGDAWEAVRALMGRHRVYLKRAAALATDTDVEWIDQLAARDTDTLMSTWWAVNGHFFLHEATVVIRGRATKARLVGPSSSSPSQPMGSETSIASGNTPTGS